MRPIEKHAPQLEKVVVHKIRLFLVDAFRRKEPTTAVAFWDQQTDTYL